MEAKSWGWPLFEGILFVVLGVVAYFYPVASTVSLTMLVATLLCIGGVGQFIHALALWGHAENFYRLLSAVVTFTAGFLMFRYPAGGMEAVALALSFYFFVSAALQWILSTAMPVGRGWALFNSILTFFLGVYMIAAPLSSLWMPGLLLGIAFIFSGINLIAYALAIKPSARLKHAAQH